VMVMSGVQQVTVSEADEGMRLDRWFRLHFPHVKQGQLQKMLRKGQVRVGGGRVQADRRVNVGEVVRVPPLPDAPEEGRLPALQKGLTPGDRNYIRSLVLYEDDWVIALNKPFGIAVQGGAKTTRHIDGMLDGLAQGGERPKLAHRLDRDTGGVLVLGRTRKATAALAEAFQRHRVQKTYWALTRGVPHPLQGRIDLPIGKEDVEGREKMMPGSAGKRAVTDFQVVETMGKRAAFVALRPETGRTHQIRVHMQAVGAPIAGDRKYGGSNAILEGISPKMHLFCREMVIPLPGRRALSLEAPLTGHMLESWTFFNFETPTHLQWPE
ncbi:MAG: RluA family pseudouridine synthase, partial [Pseudomonadota bacterium]